MTDPSSPDAFAATLRAKIDGKTKPLGALGRIEALAAQIATRQGSLAPRMERCRLTIFAADHGIAAAGVSAYPQAVTRQMVANFAGGGAAANVFCRSVGVELKVVDAGVAGGPTGVAGVAEARLGDGTANSLLGPAMTDAQRDEALRRGAELGAEGAFDAMAFGEMGIANTSAASLLAHKIAGLPIAELAGPGTGLDAEGVARKAQILARAAARTGALTAEEALAEYGGFEIAMMAGAMIGAARAGRLVLVDGYIATAAALASVRIAPDIAGALVYAHRSAEPGHDMLLAHLDARPLLDLGLRLGEGTGAVLAWPLVQAAARMLTEMASFEAAGVSGPA